MTWLPGQGSVPHDHAGSICALRIVRGHVRESFYMPARDGLVDHDRASELVEGEVIVDASDHVHSLMNAPDAPETLVTLHVYAPPLPELRRFAARPSGASALPVFVRAPGEDAPVVSIVGGGFSGTLVAAHLMRLATDARQPVHVVVRGSNQRPLHGRRALRVPSGMQSARRIHGRRPWRCQPSRRRVCAPHVASPRLHGRVDRLVVAAHVRFRGAVRGLTRGPLLEARSTPEAVHGD